MSKDIDQALRETIIQSGLTYYRLGKDSGISQHCIARFVQGKRTMRLNIATKLARHLNLELTPVEPGKKGR